MTLHNVRHFLKKNPILSLYLSIPPYYEQILLAPIYDLLSSIASFFAFRMFIYGWNGFDCWVLMADWTSLSFLL